MIGCSSRLDRACTLVMHSKYQYARITFSRLPCALCQGLHTTWSHTFSRKWLRRPELLRKGVWDARLPQHSKYHCTNGPMVFHASGYFTQVAKTSGTPAQRCLGCSAAAAQQIPLHEWAHGFSRKWLRRPELLCKGVWDARLPQHSKYHCTNGPMVRLSQHSKYHFTNGPMVGAPAPVQHRPGNLREDH